MTLILALTLRISSEPNRAEPPKPDTVLATVGKAKITVKDLIAAMDRWKIPPDQRDFQSERFLQALIKKHLNLAALAEAKITVSEKKLQQMLVEKFGKDATIDW